MHPVLAAHAGLDQPWVVDAAATATALPGLARDRARRVVLVVPRPDGPPPAAPRAEAPPTTTA